MSIRQSPSRAAEAAFPSDGDTSPDPGTCTKLSQRTNVSPSMVCRDVQRKKMRDPKLEDSITYIHTHIHSHPHTNTQTKITGWAQAPMNHASRGHRANAHTDTHQQGRTVPGDRGCGSMISTVCATRLLAVSSSQSGPPRGSAEAFAGKTTNDLQHR